MAENFEFDVEFDSDWESKQMKKYKASLMECVQRQGIQLKKGDSVRSSRVKYRDEGVLLWNGKKLVELDTWPDEYGTTPKEFSIPEYLPGVLQRAHNNLMWIDTKNKNLKWYDRYDNLINHKGDSLNKKKQTYPAWSTSYGWKACFEIGGHRYFIHQFCLQEVNFKGVYQKDHEFTLEPVEPYLKILPWTKKNPLWKLIREGKFILLDLANEDEIEDLNLSKEERSSHFTVYNSDPYEENN